MIRKIRLYGLDNGKTIDFSTFDKYIFTAPTGFGFKVNNEYMDVGYKRIRISQTKEYQSISGTIEVVGETRDDWERNYNELRDFCAKNKKTGIKLFYSALQNVERYIICDINEVGKTEKSKAYLPINFVIDTKTNWLEDKEIDTQLVKQDLNEKSMGFYETDLTGDWKYSYGFLYNADLDYYSYKFEGNAVGEAVLINNGDDTTPLLITIFGECNNPTVLLLDVNGNTLQSAKINTLVDENQRLIINSDIDNLAVRLITATGTIIDKTAYVDTDRTTYIELPVGTYTLRVLDEGDTPVNAKVKFSWQFLGA
jgi:hypothetical protein